MANGSFRLGPDETDSNLRALLERHINKVAPPGVTIQIYELHGGRPWKASAEGRYFEAAKKALKEAFGTTPVLMGGGGSIAIVVEFEERLSAPVLLVGFSLPGCNLHAPNEWLPVENFERGIVALAHLYKNLAD